MNKYRTNLSIAQRHEIIVVLEEHSVYKGLGSAIAEITAENHPTKVCRIASHSSPCYLRLGKAGEPVVHQVEPDFVLGKGLVLKEGTEATLISTGGMLKMALEACEHLQSQGCSVRLVSMPTVYPIDRSLILESARLTPKLITLEEHGIGGLGTIVAEVLAESGIATNFTALRLDRDPAKVAGSQNYWRGKNQLSIDSLTKLIVNNGQR